MAGLFSAAVGLHQLGFWLHALVPVSDGIFGCHSWESPVNIPWDKARHAAKYPEKHRMVPNSKEACGPPNVTGRKILRGIQRTRSGSAKLGRDRQDGTVFNLSKVQKPEEP